VTRRLYYLANYLLVKGSRSYLFYFASSTLEWYPEWQIDLGPPATTPANVDALAWQGVYRRDFASGVVLLNPSPSAVSVTLPSAMRRVDAQGGGAVPSDGSCPRQPEQQLGDRAEPGGQFRRDLAQVAQPGSMKGTIRGSQ
jgi:hypothetical protein